MVQNVVPVRISCEITPLNGSNRRAALAQADGDITGIDKKSWEYMWVRYAIDFVGPLCSTIATFDEPWPKLNSGKAELEALLAGSIDSAQLMEILTDHETAEDHELPTTGVSLDIERLLSSRFIRSPEYGTRACCVVTIDANQRVSFSEQNYTDAEHSGALVHETFNISSP